MLNKLTDRPAARRLSKWLTAGLTLTLPVLAATSAGAAPAVEDAPTGGAAKPAATAKANPKPAAAAKANTVENRIVKAAQQEIGTAESGGNCQKYSSQCVSWCGLFAMSTWEQAGVQVDHEDYSFTGDIYTAGQAQGKSYDSTKLKDAKPGDVLLFGTGPQSSSTSKHIGVVEKVRGNTVTLIEGNTGDNPDRVMRKDHQLSPDTFYGGVHPL